MLNHATVAPRRDFESPSNAELDRLASEVPMPAWIDHRFGMACAMAAACIVAAAIVAVFA